MLTQHTYRGVRPFSIQISPDHHDDEDVENDTHTDEDFKSDVISPFRCYLGTDDGDVDDGEKKMREELMQ